MNSNRKTSRIAGFWYLLVAIFGSFYSMFVESELIVSGDAAATVNNILASERLFRLGVLSNLITTICFLFLANALYKLFKSVDKDLVRLMVIFIIASVPVAYLQFLKFAPILLSSKAAYLSAFEPAQLQALAMVFLDLGKLGSNITDIFFGLWMFPLGMLVFKSGSGFIPKALGVLLMVGCCGYLFRFLTVFLALNYEAISSLWMTITIIGEVLCILWLLIIGPKDQKPASIEAS
ncbi:MAG: DUF4386 domain-containing protein [Chloroflexi bacterium]|nr:DUF4386 domain-containing protein [Chloroflexota bacterium]